VLWLYGFVFYFIFLFNCLLVVLCINLMFLNAVMDRIGVGVFKFCEVIFWTMPLSFEECMKLLYLKPYLQFVNKCWYFTLLYTVQLMVYLLMLPVSFIHSSDDSRKVNILYIYIWGLNDLNISFLKQPCVQRVSWQIPWSSYVKCNVDGSVLWLFLCWNL
jgi:hypothetical protein